MNARAEIGQTCTKGSYPRSKPGGAALRGIAGRQDRGYQVLKRAGEVLLADQDSAVTGVDDIDRTAWHRPVRRREGRNLPDEVFPAVGVGEAPGVERPAADAPFPADLGDHNPHPAQFAPARSRRPGLCPWRSGQTRLWESKAVFGARTGMGMSLRSGASRHETRLSERPPGTASRAAALEGLAAVRSEAARLVCSSRYGPGRRSMPESQGSRP